MALTKVGKGALDKGAIKNQTVLNEQANDSDRYLIYDASADELKYITAANVTPNETLITDKTALSAADLATDDQLLIYDTSAASLKKIAKSDLVAAVPSITTVTPSNALSGDGTGNYEFTITGSGFENSTVTFIGNDATTYTADTTTTNSTTSITAVIAKSSLPTNNEPYDVKVTNFNSLTNTTTDAFNIDAQPAWVTASGALTGIFDGARSGISITLEATDPESGAITYALVTGSLPSGLSLNTTTGVISGDANAVGTNTTSSFTIEARDANSNATERNFSITVYAPSVQTFTSSGTFTVPTGLTSVDVLVVAGGGGIIYVGGGTDYGGAGAGGLIYRPAYPITPGTPISVTVGSGGQGSASTGCYPGYDNNPGLSTTLCAPRTYSDGQDSTFGTLIAKGGGAGTGGPDGNPGGSGGSSGGCGTGSNPVGTATQPTQPGDSGTYGFGNNSGQSTGNDGAGGGGAGGSGGNFPGPGTGGVGRAYSISGTSVYYAGGGGGGGETVGPTSGGNGGGGSGGGASQTGSGGTANRGGGAGGGDNAHANAPGGKGVVIVSY